MCIPPKSKGEGRWSRGDVAGHARGTLLRLVVGMLVAVPGCEGVIGLGMISVGLGDATACAEHCVDGFGAQLFDEANLLPLGPAREVACGEPIVFINLQAGRRVWVHAYATRAGVSQFEGQSGPVEVIEDQVVTVPVTLRPQGYPTIERITPDPALPGETLTIEGVGFGQGDGPKAVYLDGRPLETSSWGDDQVAARLDPKDDGGFLTVGSCGVTSSPRRLRVLVDTPGVEVLRPLGCSGWTIEDATAVVGTTDMVLGLGCKDPNEGYLVRYDPTTCTPFGLPTPLHSKPLSLSPAWTAPEVFVAVGQSLYRVSVPLPSELPAPLASASSKLDAVAATSSRLFCLGSDKVLTEVGHDGSLKRIHEDLTVTAIASAPARMVAIGKAADDKPVLAVIPDSGPRVDVRLDADPKAVALSVDGQMAVVGCSGSLVLRVNLGSFEVLVQAVVFPTDSVKVALDLASDVALLFDPASGMLGAVSFGPSSRTRTWSLPPRMGTRAFARHPGQDHFFLTGPQPGEMTVVAPYEKEVPCKLGEVAP